MKLENWSVAETGDGYTPPERRFPILQGNVFGHPGRHEDGKLISTSPIIKLVNGKILTKSGSEYELGKIDEEYEKCFPNARQRLLDSFDENGEIICKK